MRFSPAGEDAFPVWIYVFLHFGFVIAFAVGDSLIKFLASGDLVEIEFHPKASLCIDGDLSVHNVHATPFGNFVFLCLPRIMGLAGKGEVRCGGRDMGHG